MALSRLLVVAENYEAALRSLKLALLASPNDKEIKALQCTLRNCVRVAILRLRYYNHQHRNT